ncbi:MAG: hypothetical protein IKO49_07860 [Bacilli bacterium]|nr:hypothetical protein [Bacilli bacterium]
MKKKIIIILLITFFITSCSKYEELNNLAIISNITITYKNKNYIVTMQEIIPKEKNNKVEYDYNYRTGSSKRLKNAFSNIINHSPKKIYLKKLQNIIIENKNKKKTLTDLLKYVKKNNNINRDSSIVITKNNLNKVIKINKNYKYIDSVLKNKKISLKDLKKLYKKKKKIALPLLKIQDKELIFDKYIYLQE